MKAYLDLLQHVLQHGAEKGDRTGIGTRSVFGYQMRYDLTQGFPLLTTKSCHWRSIVYELLWFLRGDTNIRYLKDHGVSIWDEWADETGELGLVYGHQWRNWQGGSGYGGGSGSGAGSGIDQISQVIDMIKHNPNSRRLMVVAWNPAQVEQMALPPCHVLFQFYVANGRLSCQLYQRSADIFLGVPFNIASYALLTSLVAQVCQLQVGDFIHTLGDAHLYNNHFEQAKLQLARHPRKLPQVRLNPDISDLFSFDYQDIELLGYEPYPPIKAEVAV